MEIKRSRRIQWVLHVWERIELVSQGLLRAQNHRVKRNLVGQVVIAELGEIKIMWDEAEHAAQNKTKWIENGVVLCLQGMK